MTCENTPNLALKKMLQNFLKLPPLKKILEFQDWKKDCETYTKKEEFKPETKPIIENLQDELYQLESEQGKGPKIHTNIKWELESEKCFRTFSKYLKDKVCEIK